MTPLDLFNCRKNNKTKKLLCLKKNTKCRMQSEIGATFTLKMHLWLKNGLTTTRFGVLTIFLNLSMFKK